MKPHLILFLGIIVGLGPFSIDFFLPASNAIAFAFAIDSSMASLNISLFITSMAVGQLIAGPLCDNYGRKKIVLICLALFIIAGLFMSVVGSITMLLFIRIVQAIMVGILTVTVDAIVSNERNIRDTARVLSLITVVSISMRIIAPILGGYTVSVYNWEVLTFVISGIAILCLVYMLWVFEESHPFEKQGNFSLNIYFQLFRSLFENNRVRTFIGMEVLASIGLFTYVSGSAYIFMEVHGFSSSGFGYILASISFVFLVAAYSNNLLVRRIGVEQLIAFTIPGMFLFSMLVLLIDFTSPTSIWMFYIFLCLYLVSMMMTRINALAGALNSVPTMAGSISSVINTLGFLAGGLTGISLTYFFQFTHMALTAILFIVASLSLWLYLLNIKKDVITSPYRAKP